MFKFFEIVKSYIIKTIINSCFDFNRISFSNGKERQHVFVYDFPSTKIVQFFFSNKNQIKFALNTKIQLMKSIINKVFPK